MAKVLKAAALALLMAFSRGIIRAETDLTSANEAVARRWLEAVSAADAGRMRTLLEPTAELTWVVAGVYSPELHAFPQGTRWDRDETIRANVALVGKFRTGFPLRVLSMVAQEGFVAAEVMGDGVRADTGRRYLQHYSIHWHMDGGRIAEIRMYEDTLLDWDVWENAGTPATHLEAPAAVGRGEGEHGASQPGGGTVGNAEENEDVVRRFLMAVPIHDAELIRDTWAPDGTWSFAEGGPYLAAEHTFLGARHWKRDAMIAMQQKAQGNLREPLTLDLCSLIAQGDRVCAEAIGILVRSSGAAYRQHYSLHFVVRNGRLVEGHVYQDTLHMYDLAQKREKYQPVAAPLQPRS
jgi:ketosteroid isomerase-like protein